MWKDLTWIAFDTETTGLDPENDRITELGIIHYQNGEVVLRWDVMLNPGIDIPAKVTEITQITNEMVRVSPPIKWMTKPIRRMLTGGVLVAYNAKFDYSFLSNALTRAKVKLPLGFELAKIIDPFTWLSELHKYEKGKSLSAMCKRYDIEVDQWHRACDDAEATVRLLSKIAPQMSDDLDEVFTGQHEMRATQVADRKDYKKRKDGVPDNVKKHLGKDEEGEWIIDFGKHKGARLSTLIQADTGYLDWVITQEFPEPVKEILRAEIEKHTKEFSLDV
jgi:DNA polymerase III subunit epsilon